MAFSILRSLVVDIWVARRFQHLTVVITIGANIGRRRYTIITKYYALSFFLNSNDSYLNHGNSRYIGLTVRPVVKGAATPILCLSSALLNVTEGDDATVEITAGSGSYSVESNDASVATAVVEGSFVKVTAVSVGIATITVTDTDSGRQALLEVRSSAVLSYPACPDDNHPHFIDLGLPSGTKKSCCNMDTDHPENQSPTNHGGYYSWGETGTKSNYDWLYYSHCEGTYNTCDYLGDDIAGTSWDVANVWWGRRWAMPSKEQMEELISSCSCQWTTIDGVNGIKFTGTNGGSIFLPATGSFNESGLNGVGSNAFYWSSTQSIQRANGAYALRFNNSSPNASSNFYRYIGHSVRPVKR